MNGIWRELIEPGGEPALRPQRKPDLGIRRTWDRSMLERRKHRYGVAQRLEALGRALQRRYDTIDLG
jgi:hypothetical protein